MLLNFLLSFEFDVLWSSELRESFEDGGCCGEWMGKKRMGLGVRGAGYVAAMMFRLAA